MIFNHDLKVATLYVLEITAVYQAYSVGLILAQNNHDHSYSVQLDHFLQV